MADPATDALSSPDQPAFAVHLDNFEGPFDLLLGLISKHKLDVTEVALVSEDLNGIPGGMVVEVAKLLKDRGFSPRNIVVSASHTHAAPTGFYNFDTFNTVFMSISTPYDSAWFWILLAPTALHSKT